MVRVEAEVGSGMEGSRPKLRRLLADAKMTTVVAEHRDRLARMNTKPVKALNCAEHDVGPKAVSHPKGMMVP